MSLHCMFHSHVCFIISSSLKQLFKIFWHRSTAASAQLFSLLSSPSNHNMRSSFGILQHQIILHDVGFCLFFIKQVVPSQSFVNLIGKKFLDFFFGKKTYISHHLLLIFNISEIYLNQNVGIYFDRPIAFQMWDICINVYYNQFCFSVVFKQQLFNIRYSLHTVVVFICEDQYQRIITVYLFGPLSFFE